MRVTLPVVVFAVSPLLAVTVVVAFLTSAILAAFVLSVSSLFT